MDFQGYVELKPGLKKKRVRFLNTTHFYTTASEILNRV